MNKRKNTPQNQGAAPQGMRPVSVRRNARGANTYASMGAPAGAGYGAQAYSRDFYQPPKKHSRGPIIALIVVLALTLLVGGAAFAGVVYMNSIGDKLHADVSDELKASL